MKKYDCYEDRSDAELIALFTDYNDQTAFEFLFHRHKKSLMYFLQNKLFLKHGSYEMEEFLQETHIKVFENIRKYSAGKSKFITWLCRLSKNLFIDTMRHKKSTVRNALLTSLDDPINEVLVASTYCAAPSEYRADLYEDIQLLSVVTGINQHLPFRGDFFFVTSTIQESDRRRQR